MRTPQRAVKVSVADSRPNGGAHTGQQEGQRWPDSTHLEVLTQVLAPPATTPFPTAADALQDTVSGDGTRCAVSEPTLATAASAPTPARACAGSAETAKPSLAFVDHSVDWRRLRRGAEGSGTLWIGKWTETVNDRHCVSTGSTPQHVAKVSMINKCPFHSAQT